MSSSRSSSARKPLRMIIGWLALARVTGRIGTGNARVGAVSALAVGLVGTALAVLHLATSSGGPGTGNGMVGAVVAIPLGLIAVAMGWRALARSRAAEGDAEPVLGSRR
ncbi:hypothetical protein K4G64_03390 [Streptomyces sp. WAC04114]|nr:hypothetical protein [Streptomyces sp. WAC04114]